MTDKEKEELTYLCNVLEGHHISNPTSLGVDMGMALLRRQLDRATDEDAEILERHWTPQF